MINKAFILVFTVLLFVSVSSFAQWDFTNTNNGKAELTTNATGTIKWTKTQYDMGAIKQNKPQKIEFEFTNTGKKPVIITKAEASCGCTGLTYSMEPVLPGKTSKIATTYDAKELGSFNKSITIYVNLDAPYHMYELNIKGTVIQN